jgi:hypothetical protein
METKDKDQPIEIFSGMEWQAEMIKDLLHNEGIQAFLNNQILGSLNLPWEGTGTVKVVVARQDYEKALQVVEAFHKSEPNSES